MFSQACVILSKGGWVPSLQGGVLSEGGVSVCLRGGVRCLV